MVGPTRIGEQAVDGLRAPRCGRQRPKRRHVGLARDHADGVERDAAEKRQIVGERRELEARDLNRRPRGAFPDPCLDGLDVFGRERIAFGRHNLFGIGARDALDDRAVLGMPGDERGAVGFAALERGGERVEPQAAFYLRALVAAIAVRLEDRFHVAEKIDAAFFQWRVFGGDLGDAVGDEMVDGVGRGKPGGQHRHGDLRRGSEPRVGRGAALGPVGGVRGPPRGPGAGVDRVEMNPPFGLVGGPTGVGVRHRVRAGRKQPPRRATGGGKRDDRLAELGAKGLFALRLNPAHDGFEHHRDRPGEFEFTPFLAVARRGETEIGTEIQVGLLRLNREFAGIAHGESGGLGERCFEDHFAVHEQPRGAARA